MSIRRFTKEEVEELLQNPNVAGCSEKSIAYQKDFKVSAIRKYNDGLPPNYIFREAEFNIALIGSKTPKWCLKRWIKTFRQRSLAKRILPVSQTLGHK